MADYYQGTVADVRKMCDSANASWGTDLYCVGSYEGNFIIESRTKQYTGCGTVEVLKDLIHAFAGGWLAAQSHATTATDPSLCPAA